VVKGAYCGSGQFLRRIRDKILMRRRDLAGAITPERTSPIRGTPAAERRRAAIYSPRRRRFGRPYARSLCRFARARGGVGARPNRRRKPERMHAFRARIRLTSFRLGLTSLISSPAGRAPPIATARVPWGTSRALHAKLCRYMPLANAARGHVVSAFSRQVNATAPRRTASKRARFVLASTVRASAAGSWLLAPADRVCY
jgi:hypothetical protein